MEIQSNKCFSFKYSRNKVAAAIFCLMVFCAFILSLFCSISSSVFETNLLFFSIVLRQSVTHRCRRQINVHLRNDADEKIQKVSGRCLILSSDHYVFNLRTSKKVRQTQFVEKNLVTVSSYRSATSYKNVLSSHDQL